jgi:hypothetical protein
VYLAVVLMLASPPDGSSGQALCELLSIPAGTLLAAPPGLADMDADTDPFVFPDMPDEAVIAIDQFLAPPHTVPDNRGSAQIQRKAGRPTPDCGQPHSGHSR